MHRALSVSLLVLAAFPLSGSGFAQEAVLEVGDLIGRARAVPAVVRSPWIERFGYRQFGRGRGIVGETELLEQTGGGPLLGVADLEAIVRELAELDKSAVRANSKLGTLAVPAEASARVQAVLDWIRHGKPPAVEIEMLLQAVSGNDTTDLLRAKQSFSAGETVTISDIQTRSLLCDFDVEIAQAATTADPIVAKVSTGACLALRARPIPGVDVAVVEAVARVAEPGRPDTIAIAHPGFGNLDRLARRINECGITFRVSRGGTASHRWTAHDGRELRLTCTARWDKPAAAGRQNAEIHASALLNRPVLGFQTLYFGRDESPTFEPSNTEITSLVEATFEAVDQGLLHWSGRQDSAAGVFVLAGTTAGPVAGQLLRSVQRALEPVRLSVHVVDVPVSVELQPQAALPEDARTVAKVSGPVLAGYPACFTGGTEATYLSDWNVEVAQAARIPDPRVEVVEAGYHLNALVRTDAVGKPVAVVVDCHLERFGGLESVRTPINVAMIAPETLQTSISGAPNRPAVGTSSRIPGQALPQDIVTIEKPIVAAHRLSALVKLGGDGTAILRRPARNLLGEGRELAVIVRVEQP